MECGELKHLELTLIDLFTRVQFGTSEAKRFRNGYLVYDSVVSGTTRFIKSSWIRMRGEIANQISAILDAREESQCGDNAFSLKRDGLMRLVEIIKGERYNQSAENRDKGIWPLSKEWLKTLGRDFDFGELVWGKIDPHPWWPGQIYDEALATLSACLTKEKGRVLVAFFGDNTYGWLEPENVVPFERHFDEKSKQSEDHLFLAAVEEALFEVKKRSALGLTCKCLNPSNFRPTEVQGFLEVDVAGFGARSKYSIEQIKKARNGFKPREMVSFLQKLALNPTIDTQNNFTLTRNVARVLAYRKSVFEEPDESYQKEFEAQAADNEHHADVSYGKKKPHQDLLSCCFCFLSARPQLEELEGSPQYPRPSDPLKIDDITKQAKLKVPEVGIQNNNLRKNVLQKRSLQDTSMPQLRIFDSDDLSRSNKKRSSPDVQEETITEKQKKGKTIDSMVARKKVVDNRGDQINTKTAAVANHEERSTEQRESLIQKRNLFGLSRPSYRIQPQKGSAAELPKWSKPNMQLTQEDRHQVLILHPLIFVIYPLKSNWNRLQKGINHD
ncbi:UNVERIFIED_CONTAM: hypothetical protein Scaly_2855800 [Sesamum calycinum]|uniref:PWWP domain-containing protein n=1 Tax=Sesamum calycinum TaxID=2727403 RepID=A0AAW2LHV4_9LAMI